MNRFFFFALLCRWGIWRTICLCRPWWWRVWAGLYRSHQWWNVGEWRKQPTFFFILSHLDDGLSWCRLCEKVCNHANAKRTTAMHEIEASRKMPSFWLNLYVAGTGWDRKRNTKLFCPFILLMCFCCCWGLGWHFNEAIVVCVCLCCLIIQSPLPPGQVSTWLARGSRGRKPVLSGLWVKLGGIQLRSTWVQKKERRRAPLLLAFHSTTPSREKFIQDWSPKYDH